MVKVLITGGAGYLGTRIASKLMDVGHKVTCLDNLMYKQGLQIAGLALNPNFDFVYGDARDSRVVLDLAKKADFVLPLAAVVGAPACSARPYDAQTINSDAIKSLVELLDKNQRIIFPNSNSGYGTTPAGTITTEETPLRPLSLYGTTKMQAEDLVTSRDNSVAFRLATVFGPSMRPRSDLLVNDFVRKALTGETIVMYEPDARRNFVYIRDVAEAFVYTLNNFDKLKEGKVFNLGCDALNSTKLELAQKVKEHLPKFSWQIGEGADFDRRDYMVSNEKLRRYGFECAMKEFDGPIEELVTQYKLILPGIDPTTNK